MINASSAFDEMVRSASRTFTARFLVAGSELDCALKTLVIHKGAMEADNGFAVGSVFTSYIEVVLDNLGVPIDGKELELQIGLTLADESVEFITIGYFTATKVKKTTYQTSFVGVGRIASVFASNAYETPEIKTISGIAESIASTTGVAVTLDSISGATETIEGKLNGLTCYEVLQVITAAVGGYATETADGQVVVKRFSSDPTEHVDATRMISLPAFAESDLTVEGARVLVREGGEQEDGTPVDEIAYTYGTPTVNMSNPFMTEDLFNNAFIPNVIGYSFRPGTIPLSMGDPRIEGTDVLQVTDRDGNEFIVPCHSLTHTFDGGVITEITAAGLSDADDPSSTGGGPITEQLNRINSALVTAKLAIIDRAKIKDLDAERARIDALNATKAYIDELVAGNVSAEDLVSDQATINSLSTTYAKIDFANVDQANISKAWIQNLLIQGGFIANNGTVFDLIGVHISGDLIDANTVKADRLLLQGANGLYYAINVDELGEATASADPKYQTGLDGSVIIAHSITAKEITTQNIQGTGGWINFAAGTFAYNNASTGHGIVWDGNKLTISTDKITLGTVDLGQAIQDALDAADAVTDMQDRMDSGEFKGDKGDPGVSVTNVTSTNNTADGGTSVVTVTLSDGTTKTFNVKNGNKGASSQWYYGNKCTHTSGTAKPATGIASAIVGDMYLNTDTYSVYRCTTAGASGIAVWTYAGNLVEGVIDGFEIGGRNLLAFSELHSPINETKCGVVFTLEEDGWIGVKGTATNTAAGIKALWQNDSSTTKFGPGVYTLTIEDPDGLFTAGKLQIQVWWKGDASAAEYYNGSQIVTREVTSYIYRVYVYFNPGAKGTTYNGRFRLKMERGNKATDWIPAPEDVAGNQNLLRPVPKSHNKANYMAYQLDLTENLKAGQTYTLQLWDVNVSHTGKTASELGTGVYWGGGSISLARWLGTSYFTNGHADRLTATFTVTESQASGSGASNPWLQIYNSPGSASGTLSFTIGRWKIEKGSIPTKWSISEEDAQKNIDTATAANATATTANNKATYHYGTCATAIGTAAKVVTLAGFTLYTGAQITVKFTNGNTAAAPTLNVNSTGAKPVIVNGATTALTGKMDFPAGTTCSFTYDGSHWQLTGTDNTNNVMDWTDSSGLTVRAKSGSQSSVNVNSGAVDIYDKNGKLGSKVNEDGLTTYKAGSKRAEFFDEVKLYDTDGKTEIAKFGAASRIGKKEGNNVSINPDGIFLNNDDEHSVFSVESKSDETTAFITEGPFQQTQGTHISVLSYDPVPSSGMTFYIVFDSTRDIFDFTAGQANTKTYKFGSEQYTIVYDGSKTIRVTANATSLWCYVQYANYYAKVKAPVLSCGTYAKNPNGRGAFSSVFGEGLQAMSDYQFVVGKFNDNDPNTIFEVGGGTSDDERSTTFYVTEDGTGRFAGPAAALNLYSYDSGKVLRVLSNSNGNRGLYLANVSNSKWLIRADANDNIFIGEKSILDLVYPVGAIYLSTVSTSPATLFGGTWERIQNRFLLAAGTSYSAGTTGGSADAVIPYHRHSVAKVDDAITDGAHGHTVNYRSVYAGGSNYSAVTPSNHTATSTGVVVSTSGTHKHDLPSHNTNYAGTSGNTSGANMPPYIAVYVWKRTA